MTVERSVVCGRPSTSHRPGARRSRPGHPTFVCSPETPGDLLSARWHSEIPFDSVRIMVAADMIDILSGDYSDVLSAHRRLLIRESRRGRHVISCDQYGPPALQRARYMNSKT